METNNKVIIASINKLRYIANTSFVIISKKGTIVVIDPFKVDPDIKPDIIAVTHTHYDHYNKDYIDKANCFKIIAETGGFEHLDIKITGIASSHHGDSINEETPDNVIYIFEVDGLRIVHFGDLGQSTLNEGQLGQIGKVDIAMMQFINPNSDFTLQNQKGLRLLQQVNPSIVIPTHAFGLKKALIGKKYFILPVHRTGKTFWMLKKLWGPVLTTEYIKVDGEEIDKGLPKAVWMNRTLRWIDICLLRSNIID
ncbi:MAG TPA: MBL fold metallo-hydrolase [Clostridia bacterium]|nr:MBL fold metallo-hydrolase [Clostridia bacterium]